jgi:hypothetical protein
VFLELYKQPSREEPMRFDVRRLFEIIGNPVHLTAVAAEKHGSGEAGVNKMCRRNGEPPGERCRHAGVINFGLGLVYLGREIIRTCARLVVIHDSEN